MYFGCSKKSSGIALTSRNFKSINEGMHMSNLLDNIYKCTPIAVAIPTFLCFIPIFTFFCYCSTHSAKIEKAFINK